MGVITIRQHYSDKALWEGEAADLRAAILAAVGSGVYLSGALLSGAKLSGADLFGAHLNRAHLDGADLSRANLSWTNLSRADLSGANLSGAVLTNAVLTNADLTGIKVSWGSHGLLAELLWRAAGEDVDRRKVAGLVLMSHDWCWDDFEARCGSDPLWAWALDTLAAHVRDGDRVPGPLAARVVGGPGGG